MGFCLTMGYFKTTPKNSSFAKVAITLLIIQLLCLDMVTNKPLEPNCPNQGPNITTLRPPSSPCLQSCQQPTIYDVQFLLYTRSNRQSAVILNALDPFSQIDLRKPIIMIFHGWIANPFFYGFQPLKEAYLNRYDCNAILVDWSKIAHEEFLVSVCKLPGLGRVVAEFLCVLEGGFAGVVSRAHVMGHSLGGQLVGFVGKSTKSVCNKTMGRITGLDPAGTAYQDVLPSERLNKFDASFVDVLHVNMGSLGEGYYGDLGDVDFYVNCGYVQPGCVHQDVNNEKRALEMTQTCSHFRVLDIMVESVNSWGFVGVSCRACPAECVSDKFDANYVVMGENCPGNAPRGAYYVKTKTCPPYSLG